MLSHGHVYVISFEEAAKALHRHLYVEEEILFPEVESRGLATAVEVMYQDHGEISRLMNTVHELISSGAGTGDIEASLAAIVAIMREHCIKEEMVLYSKADQVLDGPEFARLVQRIREEPAQEGWLCRLHSSGK